MEELFLCTFLAGNKLDIVNQKDIGFPVFVVESIDGPRGYCRN